MNEYNELSAGEIAALQVIYDARDDLIKTLERWNKPLTVKRFSLKDYVNGKIDLAIDLRWLSDGERQRPVLRQAYAGEGHAHSNAGFGIDHAEPKATSDSTEGSDRPNQDQDTVFVCVVEVTEGIEHIIPSLIRFYFIDDQVDKTFADPLYLSVANHRFHTLPSLLDGKGNVGTGLLPAQNDQLKHHMIQCRAQVMDSIPDNQSDVIRRVGNTSDFEGKPFEIVIVLDRDTVEVRIDERIQHIVKVNDVLISAFEL